jgi:DNA gyrase subunit A
VRFKQDDVRPMGRPAAGVIGVSLGEGDRVVGMSLAREGADLLVVTERGYGKRTALDDYPRKGRATSGVITIKLRTDDDRVAAASVVTDTSLLTFITTTGTVMRTEAEGISRFSRSTQGVTILNLNLNRGDRLASLAQEEPSELDIDGQDDGAEQFVQVLISPNGEEE